MGKQTDIKCAAARMQTAQEVSSLIMNIASLSSCLPYGQLYVRPSSNTASAKKE